MRTAAAVLVVVLFVTPSIYPSVPKSPATAHPPLHASPKSPVSGVYTDDPLVGGVHVIRLVHLAELRAAINDIRIAAGLPTYIWADPQPSIVRAVHVVQLRAALAEALPRLGRSVPPWTDPALTTGSSIRAVHLQEIRNATRWGPSDRSSAITTDTIWIPENSPYVIRSTVTIYGGVTLTIRPGVVVKFAPGTDLEVTAGARLIADGTSLNLIYFTSLRDDTVGGDTNGDGAATTPSPGDWRLLVFGDTGGVPASGSLTNAVVRYGTSLVVRRSAPTLHDVTSTQMSGDGLNLESPPAGAYTIQRLTLTNNTRNLTLSSVPATTVIRDSVIRGATEIALLATNGTAAQILSNSIDDNKGGAAILPDSTSPIVLHYNSITNNRTTDGMARGVNGCCVTVDAKNNWWGSTTGPSVVDQSNSGGGAQVSGNVLVDPWLGKTWKDGFKLGDHPWTLKAGVGTDIATGNFHLVEKDLSIPTVGFPLEIVRTYNNKSAGGTQSDFGDGWTWNYGTSLQAMPGDDGVLWYRDDGAQTFFKRNPDNTYSGEEGIYEKLVREPSTGVYRMTRKDQSVLVFASDGRLSYQIDANGNTTTITRNGNGRVTRVTEALGRSLTFTYDSQYIIQITDPLGRTVNYQRNSNGAISTVTRRDQFGTISGTSNYYYGNGGRWEMTGFDDADGNHLDQTFDIQQRVSTQRFNYLAQITFQYDPYVTYIRDTHNRYHSFYYTDNNKVLRHQHEQSNGTYNVEDEWNYVGYLSSAYTDLDGTTVSEYDWSKGNLVKLTEPGNRVTTYAYDQFNNLIARTDGNFRTTTFSYDSHQNLVREQNALNETTLHSYYANGLKQTDTDPLNHVTLYTYDPSGYPATVTNALNQTTRFEYDAVGRKTSETDPLGNRTSYTYNGRDQLIDVADPLGNHTAFSYDTFGRRQAVTDAEGHTTTYSYNFHNLPWTTTDAASGVVELTYDDSTGNLIQVADADYHVTLYTYDDLDRKTSETDGLNRRWRFEYVGRNRPSRIIAPNGQSTYKYYDITNALVQVDYPDYRSVTYSYDNVGNKIRMSDWTGETRWVYDQLNRIINVNRGNPDTAYGYDAAGNLAWVRAENFKPVSYSYDAANRLTGVTDWTGRTTTYTYDPAGRVSNCAYPNGVNGARFYDAGGRLLRIAYARSGTTIDSRDYTYNRVGSRTSETDSLSQRTNYYYDNVDRLYFTAYPTNSEGLLYGYDPAGNRTSSTWYRNGSPIGSTAYYYYDAANQAINDTRGTCDFDARGQQIRSGERTFVWNGQQRLDTVRDNLLVESWLYDGDGRRIQQNINNVFTSYVVDTRPALSRVLTETTSGVTTYYVYGLELLYTVEGGQPNYLHSDAIGSVIRSTSSSGQDEFGGRYDSFGLLSGASWGYWPKRLFLGEESDHQQPGAGESLVYLRARYYDTKTGRFVSRDPVFPDLASTQSLNPYAYCENDPLSHTDPSGEFIDTLADIGFLAYDFYDIGRTLKKGQQPTLLQLGALGADVGAAFLPFVTGAGLAVKTAAHSASASKGSYTVYRALNEGGSTIYIGISTNLERRAAEHLAQRGLVIRPIRGASGLSRTQARGVEQALIERYGLGGQYGQTGQLLNKINSISPYNQIYTSATGWGTMFLKGIGFY